MVVDSPGLRWFCELGEGRRLRQDWEAAPNDLKLRFEDLSGGTITIRAGEIVGIWERNARMRAVDRAIDAHIDAEKKAAKKVWDEE